MPLKKIVGIFYLIYTVYILLICWLTDVTPLYIFSGLTALWVMYGCFLLGDRAAGRFRSLRLHQECEEREEKGLIV